MIPLKTSNRSIAAFLDIGTNAIRMLVIQLHADGKIHVLDQCRQVLRLGEDTFSAQRIKADAIQRTALLCRQWVKAARAAGAGDIVAVATSATRDAQNRRAFLRRLRTTAGLEVRVLSGEDEARLIYLGVSRNMDMQEQQALFLDIGGGSTEVIIGDRQAPRYLATLNLGAIRLSHQLLKATIEHPVSPALYRRLQDRVRARAQRVLQRLRRYQTDMVFGSSGTIMSLADIAMRHNLNRQLQCPETISLQRLQQVIRKLCSLPLAQRRQVPGLQPDRADIIIGGAAILETFMQELQARTITVSDHSLRDGLVQEHLALHFPGVANTTAPYPTTH